MSDPRTQQTEGEGEPRQTADAPPLPGESLDSASGGVIGGCIPQFPDGGCFPPTFPEPDYPGGCFPTYPY
jgi:hypothetical protein